MQFTHLAEGLAYYDQQFWLYLKSIGADDLLFCYRWLLLELKREFAFEDALKMMEVMWASLPYKPQDVPLYEVGLISCWHLIAYILVTNCSNTNFKFMFAGKIYPYECSRNSNPNPIICFKFVLFQSLCYSEVIHCAKRYGH